MRQIQIDYGRKKQIVTTSKSLAKTIRTDTGGLVLQVGVGLRFVRDLEQGKKTLRMDKVNAVLALFGKELGIVEQPRGGEL